ncbi:MAG: NAD/NADP octopine/nopaline dehydrogenase family protein [Christensenellales bacterium]
MKRVTVFGGGATGHVVAADLALRGFEVCLCENKIYSDSLKGVMQSKEIAISGPCINGIGKIHTATTDMKTAIEFAAHIIICTISNRDEEVAELISPFMRDGQAILLSAGNLGSYIYQRVFAKNGVRGVLVGETCGNLFPSRIIADCKTITGLPRSAKPAAAWPTSNTEKLIDAFKDMYELHCAQSILHCALDVGNMLSHIGPVLLNTGAIENRGDKDYYLFKQGISPSVIRLVDQMWKEKKIVMDALGYSCSPSVSKLLNAIKDPDNNVFDAFLDLSGPNSIKGRHISEDTPILVCLMISVAQALGIELPIFKAMVQIASAINDCDYYSQGRTLKNLGLGHLRGIAVAEYFG